jgi:hypothetical protein
MKIAGDVFTSNLENSAGSTRLSRHVAHSLGTDSADIWYTASGQIQQTYGTQPQVRFSRQVTHSLRTDPADK